MKLDWNFQSGVGFLTKHPLCRGGIDIFRNYTFRHRETVLQLTLLLQHFVSLGNFVLFW